MTAKELIAAYRHSPGIETLEKLLPYYACRPLIKNEPNEIAQPGFRTELIQALLPDFTLEDIDLIRNLLEEETRYEHSPRKRENIYQLCFYLFELKQPIDCFVIYQLQFDNYYTSLSGALDPEMITVGNEIKDMIAYIENEFAVNPALEIQFSGIIGQLNLLFISSSYKSIAAYREFLHAHFYKK